MRLSTLVSVAKRVGVIGAAGALLLLPLAQAHAEDPALPGQAAPAAHPVKAKSAAAHGGATPAAASGGHAQPAALAQAAAASQPAATQPGGVSRAQKAARADAAPTGGATGSKAQKLNLGPSGGAQGAAAPNATKSPAASAQRAAGKSAKPTTPAAPAAPAGGKLPAPSNADQPAAATAAQLAQAPQPTLRLTGDTPPPPTAASGQTSCSLAEPEQPRGGRLDVLGERFGSAPVVRIAGKPARMLERRADRISVQIPADSDGGAITLQSDGKALTCGKLVIIGKNR
jgi:hypothetical protein